MYTAAATMLISHAQAHLVHCMVLQDLIERVGPARVSLFDSSTPPSIYESLGIYAEYLEDLFLLVAVLL
jgi:hypothetical protein